METKDLNQEQSPKGEKPKYVTGSTREKNTLKDYFSLGEIGGYFFRKKDPNRPSNFNIKAMHGINKLSILIFLAAVIFMIVKRLF